MEQIKKFVNTERQRLDGETVSKFLETIGQVVLLSFTATNILFKGMPVLYAE